MLGVDNVRGDLGGAYGRSVIVSGNTCLLKSGKVVFAIFRFCRGLDGRQYTIFFIGQQIPALFADSNDAPDLFTRFLIIQRQAVIPLADQFRTALRLS